MMQGGRIFYLRSASRLYTTKRLTLGTTPRYFIYQQNKFYSNKLRDDIEKNEEKKEEKESIIDKEHEIIKKEEKDKKEELQVSVNEAEKTIELHETQEPKRKYHAPVHYDTKLKFTVIRNMGENAIFTGGLMGGISYTIQQFSQYIGWIAPLSHLSSAVVFSILFGACFGIVRGSMYSLKHILVDKGIIENYVNYSIGSYDFHDEESAKDLVKVLFKKLPWLQDDSFKSTLKRRLAFVLAPDAELIIDSLKTHIHGPDAYKNKKLLVRITSDVFNSIIASKFATVDHLLFLSSWTIYSIGIVFVFVGIYFYQKMTGLFDRFPFSLLKPTPRATSTTNTEKEPPTENAGSYLDYFWSIMPGRPVTSTEKPAVTQAPAPTSQEKLPETPEQQGRYIDRIWGLFGSSTPTPATSTPPPPAPPTEPEDTETKGKKRLKGFISKTKAKIEEAKNKRKQEKEK